MENRLNHVTMKQKSNWSTLLTLMVIGLLINNGCANIENKDNVNDTICDATDNFATEDSSLYGVTSRMLDSAYRKYTINMTFVQPALLKSVNNDNKEEALMYMAKIDSLYDEMAGFVNEILLMWAYRPIETSNINEYLGRENRYYD